MHAATPAQGEVLRAPCTVHAPCQAGAAQPEPYLVCAVSEDLRLKPADLLLSAAQDPHTQVQRLEPAGQTDGDSNHLSDGRCVMAYTEQKSRVSCLVTCPGMPHQQLGKQLLPQNIPKTCFLHIPLT